MDVDCLREPLIIAFWKSFGATAAILAAAAAWLLNNAVRYLVWRNAESRRESELLKGLKAEMNSFSGKEGEDYWADPSQAERLIDSLTKSIGPLKPLAPYLIVYEETIVLNSIKNSLTSLPTDLIESIVIYYYQTLALNRQLSDFRSEFFKSMNRSRQCAVIRDAFEIGKEARKARETALAKLDEFQQTRRARRFLTVMSGLIATLFLLPRVVEAAGSFIENSVIPAVVWASSCDLTPHSGATRERYSL